MKLLTTVLALLISTTAIASPRPLDNWAIAATKPITVTAQAGCVGFNLTEAEARSFGAVLVALPQAIKEKGLEAKFDEYMKTYKINGNPLNLSFLLKAYGGGCNALARRISAGPTDSCVSATQTEAAALGFVFVLMRDFLALNSASDAITHYATDADLHTSATVLYKLSVYIKGTK